MEEFFENYLFLRYKKMDFRPTQLSPPSWIFCQDPNGIVITGKKFMKKLTHLTKSPIQ
jgi:hypothetical protein